MAVISESAARRLRPSSTPTSTAMGMLSSKVLGSMKRKSWRTVRALELLRTTISRISSSGFMKRMKVKSAQPSTEWEVISPRM
jgi:hypothetical protein